LNETGLQGGFASNFNRILMLGPKDNRLVINYLFIL
jgi:hypothetical protein